MDFTATSGDYIYEDDNSNIDDSITWKNVALDVKKFPKKKFSDILDAPFYNVNKFVPMENIHESHISAYSHLDFYAYKYTKENGFHPAVYKFNDFKMDKFIDNLIKTGKVPTNSYLKITYQCEEDPKITSILISFSKSILMLIEGDLGGVIFYDINDENNKDSLFYSLMGVMRTYKNPRVSKNKIFIVYRSPHGFDKIGFDVKKIKIDLFKNYNNGFNDFSEKIIDGLNSKQKTNLVILSGEPGTGKTTFIRYLTSKLKKNIIFISPDMVESITDPAFIPFLMKNNDSILIIEDAEPALEKRNQGGRSSAVSNVLNLTDGLLSDCLNISIVATFNTGTKNIDDALTRKGRLLMNYKFDKLNIEKSKELLESLGHNNANINEPMTLADIYFYGTDNNIGDSPKKIGFS